MAILLFRIIGWYVHSNYNQAECKGLAGNYSFYVRHFEAARKELNVSGEWNNIGKSYARKFSKARTHSCLYNINGTLIQYITVYKGANNNIRANLQYAGGTPRKDINVRGFCKFSNEDDLVLLAKRQWHWLEPVRSFTFVRHPFDHFASGMAESYYRTTKRSDEEESPPEISKRAKLWQVKDILVDILNGTARYMTEVYHFHPMSGIFIDWHPTYIGRLENFSSGWREVQSLYGVDLPYIKTLGSHPTSSDPNSIRKSLEYLIHKRTDLSEYVRAMCHILLLDFLCFNYTLPYVCKDIDV
jgi:hypothetical protein